MLSERITLFAIVDILSTGKIAVHDPPFGCPSECSTSGFLVDAVQDVERLRALCPSACAENPGANSGVPVQHDCARGSPSDVRAHASAHARVMDCRDEQCEEEIPWVILREKSCR
jgi:hypothetical protein